MLNALGFFKCRSHDLTILATANTLVAEKMTGPCPLWSLVRPDGSISQLACSSPLTLWGGHDSFRPSCEDCRVDQMVWRRLSASGLVEERGKEDRLSISLPSPWNLCESSFEKSALRFCPRCTLETEDGKSRFRGQVP